MAPGQTGDLGTTMKGETGDTRTGLYMGTMGASHSGILTTHHHMADTVVGGVVTGSTGDKTKTGTIVVTVTGTGEVTEDSDIND